MKMEEARVSLRSRRSHPVADLAPAGTSICRRRIKIETVTPGVVVHELEDDYHHFRCAARRTAGS